MINHLMLRGNEVTIPICGDTTIGKLVTHTARNVECEDCLAELEILKGFNSYQEAVDYISLKNITENLAQHHAEGRVAEAVLGVKETYWSNMEKFIS